MLTAEEIEADRQERAYLQPIAELVGLEVDPSDERLMRALACIADARAARGLTSAQRPARPTPAGGSTAHSSASSKPDLGDLVVERMRAQREGRVPAAWAASQPAPRATAPRHVEAHQRDDGGDHGDATATAMRRIQQACDAAAATRRDAGSAQPITFLSPTFRL